MHGHSISERAAALCDSVSYRRGHDNPTGCEKSEGIGATRHEAIHFDVYVYGETRAFPTFRIFKWGEQHQHFLYKGIGGTLTASRRDACGFAIAATASIRIRVSGESNQRLHQGSRSREALWLTGILPFSGYTYSHLHSLRLPSFRVFFQLVDMDHPFFLRVLAKVIAMKRRTFVGVDPSFLQTERRADKDTQADHLDNHVHAWKGRHRIVQAAKRAGSRSDPAKFKEVLLVYPGT
ncbi:hypothetical protein CCUS01_12760 [Colletotrichum cuscutae]|uniref:Uncharacterized protein n=1 Tax=Colletotrichum cuscutae TaxID=1209917 RepID=A0AAI9XFD2_9PEZI|nr:hypothetical protein CCUS01_12760 [Colletotrichum cuscutae]